MEAGQVLTTHVVLVFSELGTKKIHGKLMCGDEEESDGDGGSDEVMMMMMMMVVVLGGSDEDKDEDRI